MAALDLARLVGARGVHRRTVTPDLTAHAIGNEGVHLLATAWIIAFAEAAAYAAVRPLLPPEYLCVGIELTCHHRAPARVGTETETEAVVEEAGDRRLRFRYQVRAGRRLLAEGTGLWGLVRRR